MEARRVAEVFEGTHSSVFLLCRDTLRTLSEVEISQVCLSDRILRSHLKGVQRNPPKRKDKKTRLPVVHCCEVTLQQ